MDTPTSVPDQPALPQQRDTIDVEDIAAACHEANRRLQLGLGQKASQPWPDCPEWLRLSIMAGVQQALDGATPEQLHELWVQHYLDDGWQHGPEKDDDAKTHPCLVPYAQLGVADRAKDGLFHAVVHALSPLLAPAEDVTELMRCPAQHLATNHPAGDGGQLVEVVCGARPADNAQGWEGGTVVASVVVRGTDATEDWVSGWLSEAMQAHHAEVGAAQLAAHDAAAG